jgi:hypothetical protein
MAADYQQRLKQRQDAGTRVEERMLQTLLSFEPTGELKIRDAQFIARMAKQFAFDEFEKIEPA